MVGLGRMGANMTRRLIRGGHVCLVYDQDHQKVRKLEAEGAIALASLDELKAKLDQPAIVWVMLPAGEITGTVIDTVSRGLTHGDIIIDGGNSHYLDDIARARLVTRPGIRFLDVGVSGGVWGLERGYCMMIGGDPEGARYLDPIFRTLAPGPDSVPLGSGRHGDDPNRTADRGYVYCGPVGSGHFVKMIHNGIEYGMMQALAEGFAILRGARSNDLPEEQRYPLDVREIAEVWRRGSVVSSWLLDLIANSLNRDPELSGFDGRVADSGEGRWTLQAALAQGTPAEVITAALFVRFRSRETDSFAEKLLSAMRHEFGGHVEAPPASGRKAS